MELEEEGLVAHIARLIVIFPWGVGTTDVEYSHSTTTFLNVKDGFSSRAAYPNGLQTTRVFPRV